VFIVIYMGVEADTTGEDGRKVVILLRILTIYMPVYDHRSTSSQSLRDICREVRVGRSRMKDQLYQYPTEVVRKMHMM
jgi:hypothetical protein